LLFPQLVRGDLDNNVTVRRHGDVASGTETAHRLLSLPSRQMAFDGELPD
jgi:hypothetical protein